MLGRHLGQFIKKATAVDASCHPEVISRVAEVLMKKFLKYNISKNRIDNFQFM